MFSALAKIDHFSHVQQQNRFSTSGKSDAGKQFISLQQRGQGTHDDFFDADDCIHLNGHVVCAVLCFAGGPGSVAQ